MGNAAERVEHAVRQLNQLTQSEAFSSILSFRLLFHVVTKPLAVEVAILEPDSADVVVGSPHRISVHDFNKFYTFIIRAFKPEMDAYLQTEKVDCDRPDTDPSVLCCVCLERQPDQVLPCTHAFCSACILAWSDRDLSCPLCRFQIKHGATDSYDIVGGDGSPESLQLLRNELIEAVGCLLWK